ncbi:MAG: hypothetical protein ABEL76_11530, partial [Bradymonadaceae bacterium]
APRRPRSPPRDRTRPIVLHAPSSRQRKGTDYVIAACAELDKPTLVLCSHRIAEIRHLVDTIVELESGRVDDVRSVGEFVDASGRAVLECQFREGAEPPADLLNRLGLESVGDGVWSGVLDWREKVPTVRKLIDTHGDALEDLVVEDVTRIGHEKAG